MSKLTKEKRDQFRAELIATMEQLIAQTERDCLKHPGTLVIVDVTHAGYQPVCIRDDGYGLMGGETAFFLKGTAGAVAVRLVEHWKACAPSHAGELTLSVMPVECWRDLYATSIRESIEKLRVLTSSAE